MCDIGTFSIFRIGSPASFFVHQSLLLKSQNA